MDISLISPTQPNRGAPLGLGMRDDFPPGFDAYRAARERFFEVLRRVDGEDAPESPVLRLRPAEDGDGALGRAAVLDDAD